MSAVSEPLIPDEMIMRFRERAEAVRRRGLPPVEGPDRQRFLEAANVDFQDFAMLGDATATLEDGHFAPRDRPAPTTQSQTRTRRTPRRTESRLRLGERRGPRLMQVGAPRAARLTLECAAT